MIAISRQLVYYKIVPKAQTIYANNLKEIPQEGCFLFCFNEKKGRDLMKKVIVSIVLATALLIIKKVFMKKRYFEKKGEYLWN